MLIFQYPNPTAFITPNPATANTILSNSPPTYQFSPGGLISGPGPAQFMLPIQPTQNQSIILYGSTPPQTFTFGSPPILCPQWQNLGINDTNSKSKKGDSFGPSRHIHGIQSSTSAQCSLPTKSDFRRFFQSRAYS